MEAKKDQYSPGICNIGIQEVKLRKKFIWLFIPLTLFFTISCIFFCNSFLLWVLLVFTSFSLIVLHFEVKYQFCILFGFFSLYNFHRLGNLQEVENKENIVKDRRRVWQIVLISSALALSFSTGVHLLGKSLPNL